MALKRISKFGGSSSTDTPAKKRKISSTQARTKLESPSKPLEAFQMCSSGIQVGDRVLVSGKDRGVVRFAGAVRFAPG